MIINYIYAIAIVILTISIPIGPIHTVQIHRLKNQINELEKKRELVYKRMADVGMIEDEMERGARLREMMDAHRSTLPRDDAVGQNARVFRPKLRAKEPSRWNPPRA